MKRLIVFSDSIGVGEDCPIHKTWVHKISEYHPEILVSNASISGNTTRMALDRMSFDVYRKPFDAIIIQFGINDCNRWLTEKGYNRVSALSFKANLSEIIERILQLGCKNIMINTNHHTNKQYIINDLQVNHNDDNIIYNNIIRKVYDIYKENCQLSDMENLIKSNYLLNDGIHLNINGHEQYFNILNQWDGMNK